MHLRRTRELIRWNTTPLRATMRTVDTSVDPMGDVDALVGLLDAAHLDRRRSAYVSFFVRFADRPSWEHAAGSDELPGWQVSAYSQSSGLMIRLSRPIRLTARELEQNRDF